MKNPLSQDANNRHGRDDNSPFLKDVNVLLTESDKIGLFQKKLL